jgi:hypothetical protein
MAGQSTRLGLFLALLVIHDRLVFVGHWTTPSSTTGGTATRIAISAGVPGLGIRRRWSPRQREGDYLGVIVLGLFPRHDLSLVMR